MANRGPGKPTKLTPEIRQRLVALVRTGNWRITSAAAVGIRPDTLRDWLKRGARGEEPYASFADDLLDGEAQAEARLVTQVAKAGTVDWKASAWILERRAGRRWGRKDPGDKDKKPTAVSIDEAAAADALELMLERYPALVAKKLAERAGGK